MGRVRWPAVLVVLTFATLLFTSDTIEATRQQRGSLTPPAGTIRFGRVTTASEVRGWGNFVVKTQFLPGERVWIYAETYGTPRQGRVDLMFHLQATAIDGRNLYDQTAEFNEATQSFNWGVWRVFALPAQAVLGVCTLRVDALNRLTGDRGTTVVNFAVVSAAGTLPSAAPPSGGGEAGPEPASAEPLSPGLEEAFALLRMRQYDDSVRVFKKALGREKPTARAYLGLAQAYDGLNAYKNVLESCDKAIQCATTDSVKAIARNTRGVALVSKASSKQPPNADDLKAAAQEFRTSLDLDPSFHMARYNLGIVMLKAGDDAAGIESLRGYLAAAPDGAAAKDAERMIANPRRAREDFAPDFSVVTIDGEHLDLESLRGRVVVLDFWASWCGPCHDSIAFLRGIQKKYAGQPVVLVSISVDTDAAAWRAAIADEKMVWRHHLDSSGRISRLFGVRPIPTTVVIDGEGIVRDRIIGVSPSYGLTLESDVRDGLKRLAAAGK
jgi:thioredoxin-like negative regulator of GroEL